MSVNKIQAQLLEGETVTAPKKDIIQMIKEYTVKVKKPEEKEELLPTRANLHGLAVRFDFNNSPEKKLRSRHKSIAPAATAPLMSLNRHATFEPSKY